MLAEEEAAEAEAAARKAEAAAQAVEAAPAQAVDAPPARPAVLRQKSAAKVFERVEDDASDEDAEAEAGKAHDEAEECRSRV